MTAAQAAARTGLTEATIRSYCGRDGRIKGVKHGRDWWIEDADLATFMALRQVGPGNKTGRPRSAPPPGPAGAPEPRGGTDHE